VRSSKRSTSVSSTPTANGSPGCDPCVALYERARGGLELPAGRDAPLTDPVVLTEIRRIALAQGLLALPR